MTMRPSWDEWFLRQAHVIAQRGSCMRLRVGALIVRDRDKRVVSGGYNGAPRGMPDCLEVGCDLRKNIDGRESCFRTLHAESNALDLAGRVDEEPHTLYCTVTPCRNCALRIVQHGITRVVYASYYESQGTREVEAIFAGNDPDTIKLLTDKYGEPGVAGWVPTQRVRFEQIQVIDLTQRIHDELSALTLRDDLSHDVWSKLCELHSFASMVLGRAKASG